jgi:hypothetical protein
VEHLQGSQAEYLFLNLIQARNVDQSPNLALELFPGGEGNIEDGENETLEQGLGDVALCLAIV